MLSPEHICLRHQFEKRNSPGVRLTLIVSQVTLCFDFDGTWTFEYSMMNKADIFDSGPAQDCGEQTAKLVRS
jgi:hypothetical protein